MYWKFQKKMALSCLIAATLNACSSDSGSGDSDTGSKTPDLVAVTRIDNETGFIVAIDGKNDTEIKNTHGLEINPSTGVFTQGKFVYTTGSLGSDKIAKYSFDGKNFQLEHELTTGEGVLPSSLIFVNETKAYLTLVKAGELAVINPQDLSITKRLDLSAYALGEGDNNPEPSSGVIRDGKLFLGLSQIDSFQTYKCQGGASVLIIDVASDRVEKHIQDPRACSSGTPEPSEGLILDEIGDIYVINSGAFGYYPGLKSGYLKIKNGAQEFDQNYFFNITDLALSGVPGERAAYPYREYYAGDGQVYANMMIPGLTSSPPNYAEDKNYLAYRLDLRNQTTTKIDVPPTTGWSASIVEYRDKIIFASETNQGRGLFYYDPSSGTDTGDQSPSLISEGGIVSIKNFSN